jgi:hypothetical protein
MFGLLRTKTESIECFIEFIDGQAISRTYDLVLLPPLPSSPFSKLDRRHTGRLRNRDNLLTWGGGGGEEGGKSYDRKKAWSSITHLILYELRKPSEEYKG